MDILNFILKQYEPLVETYGGDTTAMYLNAISGGIIGFTFFIIGMSCIIWSGYSAVEPGAKQRRTFTQMIGTFTVLCGICRLFEVFCMWYNYAIIDGILRTITAISAIITVCYIPHAIKAVRDNVTLQEVSKQLKETSDKVDKFKQVSDKLTEGLK